MPAFVALMICMAVILVLLSIERRRHKDVSSRVWIPTVYMLIIGSRPLGTWFHSGSVDSLAAEELIAAGSPIDRAVLMALYALAFLLVAGKRIAWTRLVSKNAWLFGLLLASLVFLFVSLTVVAKWRWWRALLIIIVVNFLLVQLSDLMGLLWPRALWSLDAYLTF